MLRKARRLRMITGCAALLAGLASGLSGASAPTSDLLGSDRGGHYWFQYCSNRADTAALPPDPRALVQPTDDKAVVFNVGWHACMNRQPATCGELRTQAAAGGRLLRGNGAAEAGWQFSGHQAASLFSISAAQYNALWLRWGLLLRPNQFDQLVAERYGTPLSPVRNPYPLPGENPNRSNGGSGQLPMALTQTRNADGSWSGQIGVTCALCHGGQVGERSDGPGLGALLGNNGLADVNLLLTEMGGANNGFYLLSLNRVRGSGNITNFQMFGLLTMFDSATWPGFLNPSLWVSGTSGSEDPPNWWNLGHRPAKFYDAGMSSDSTRIELSWYMPYAATPLYQQGYDWILDNEYSSNLWLLGVQSPAYPLPIDTTLAEQGSVLFHTLDLWASTRNNPTPQPAAAGNGSCASCHGAYAPRYINDPGFLATPLLAGMAGNVTPINIINTDQARLNANTVAVETLFRDNFFGYNGQLGCVDEYNATGYLAQPLYGVWASAPYFHNGSVPDVWSVLKSSERPAIWRRMSKPNASGVFLGVEPVVGFETDLARAYDSGKLGWKYDRLQCGSSPLTPYLQCNPADPYDTPLVQASLGRLFANGSLSWNLLGTLTAPTFTKSQIEARKIYNTRMYSQSNSGHEFTDVLTDPERRAIVEYLKTL